MATTNQDITKLFREGANTALDIAEMTQYRIQYVQERDQEAKRKMYKYALLSCLGIASLFAIGISAMTQGRKNNCPMSWDY